MHFTAQSAKPFILEVEMRKLVAVLIILSVPFLAVKPANACGDKTMRVGGGLRFFQLEAKKNPSTILIHAQSFPAGRASRLQEFLKAVGHRAHTFENVDQVGQEFKTSHYDVVLTNLANATDLQTRVTSVSPKTVVVPVTFKSEEAAAAKQYKVTVKNPKYAEDFLPAINRVMKARAKNA